MQFSLFDDERGKISDVDHSSHASCMQTIRSAVALNAGMIDPVDPQFIHHDDNRPAESGNREEKNWKPSAPTSTAIDLQ